MPTGKRLRSEEEKAVWRTFAFLCIVAGLLLPFISSSVIIDRLAIYLIVTSPDFNVLR